MEKTKKQKIIFALNFLKESKNKYNKFEINSLLIDIQELQEKNEIKAIFKFQIDFFEKCNFTIIKNKNGIGKIIKL